MVDMMLVAGGGGVGPGGQPMGHCPGDFIFLFLEIIFTESYVSSRHPCVVGPRPGSRQKALCPPGGVECAVPRASSWHRLCRGELCLCREHLALSKSCESDSEDPM
jgi:hypothetical protein